LTNFFFLPGEQQFHERITPSLKQDVEHVNPWTDFPAFESLKDLDIKFTEDVTFMEQFCGEILEKVDISPSSQSPLLLVAIAIQSVPESSSIQAIQLCTPYQNIVFKVRISFKLLYGQYLSSIDYTNPIPGSISTSFTHYPDKWFYHQNRVSYQAESSRTLHLL